MRKMAVDVVRKVSNIPKLDWGKIKDLVLGRKYDLGVALVGGQEMRRVGKISKHRKRANVLSFDYSQNSGEILLNIPQIRREAKASGKPTKHHLAHLYIHSLLHLKGYNHKKSGEAKSMAKQEMQYMAKSGF